MRAKCVVAIAEGVDFGLLRRECERGTLPWWRRALERGQVVRLDCGPVPYEPSNLATAFSGVGAGGHGCYSYWRIHGGNPPPVLGSADVKATRMWGWPELSDLRFSVANIQLTHPVESLNGSLLAYLMQQSLHACYPRDLTINLARRGIRTAHDVSAFYRGEPPEQFAAEVARIADYQFETTMALAEDCDVLIANFTMPDRVSHFFWAEVEKEHELDLGRRPYVVESYRFLDRAFERLGQAVGDDVPILIFTEMGFGKLSGFVSLDRMLQRVGLQTTGADGHAVTATSRAREAVQGSHGIILTGFEGIPLERRDSAPGYAAAMEEVCDALVSLRFEDGSPVVARARPRDEVYRGPWVHLAPDIVIEPADPARPPLGDARWANHVRRDLQTGWHRTDGFALLLNASTPALGDVAGMTSIAPTVMRMLGRDVPLRCEGSSLIV